MIVSGIATIPSRINQVQATIESLLPQVDKINLSLNHYTDIPEVFRHPKIDAQITQGTDEQKFRNPEGEIYLGCDDDLIYPYNYVAVIRNAFEELDRRNFHLSALGAEQDYIITFHGRNFHSFPIQSYYKSKSIRYRCLDKVAQDIQVQFGGTGCMAFNPEKFKLSLSDLPNKCMADIQVAIAAKRQGLNIICLAHEAGWIKYQHVTNTIHDRFKDSDYEQTALVNSF